MVHIPTWLLATVLLFICEESLAGPVLSEHLEDFDNFLKQTVDAEPDDDLDDTEALRDPRLNHWEKSGKFEGDILLSDRQRGALIEQVATPGLARNGLNDVSKRWPDNTLVYSISDKDFNDEQKSAILDGMSDLERSSCVKFREKNGGDKDYVQIQGTPRGCYSHVGFQGRGAQLLNLAPHPPGLGCMRHGTVVHELLHALGFFHMQSHTKRDDYVKIVWDNILSGRENNFKKYNSFVSTDFGVPYDYDSVLHYSQFAFSKNGKKTIVPLKDETASIGQRSGMSDKDALKLNRMYKCDGGGSGNSVGGGGGGGSEFGGFGGSFSEELQDSPRLYHGFAEEIQEAPRHEDGSYVEEHQIPQRHNGKYVEEVKVPLGHSGRYADELQAPQKHGGSYVGQLQAPLRHGGGYVEEQDSQKPQQDPQNGGEDDEEDGEQEATLNGDFPWRSFLPSFFNFDDWW